MLRPSASWPRYKGRSNLAIIGPHLLSVVSAVPYPIALLARSFAPSCTPLPGRPLSRQPQSHPPPARCSRSFIGRTPLLFSARLRPTLCALSLVFCTSAAPGRHAMPNILACSHFIPAVICDGAQCCFFDPLILDAPPAGLRASPYFVKVICCEGSREGGKCAAAHEKSCRHAAPVDRECGRRQGDSKHSACASTMALSAQPYALRAGLPGILVRQRVPGFRAGHWQMLPVPVAVGSG